MCKIQQKIITVPHSFKIIILLIYKHGLSYKINTVSITYYRDSVIRLVDTTVTALGLK